MRILLAIALLLVVSFAHYFAVFESLPKDLIKSSIDYQGNKRHYYLYYPESITEPVPLYVLLHGSSANAKKILAYSKFYQLKDKYEIAILVPESKNILDWDLDSDAEYLDYLIDDISKHYAIDDKQIFIVGYSSGGYLAQKLACNSETQLAGIAMVSSAMPRDLAKDCNAGDIKVLIFNGIEDPDYQWSKSIDPEIYSVENTFMFWLSQNSCSIEDSSKRKLPDHDPKDGTVVERLQACNDQVVIYGIDNGGHTWPGADTSLRIKMFLGRTTYDIDANRIIVKNPFIQANN